MRVLVTGAGGFVGRNLVRHLNDRHRIVALDRSCAGLEVERRIEGDLTDPTVLRAAFSDPVDAVVHLATVAGGAAEEDGQAGWAVNVNGSFHLLEAACRTGSRPRVVFASSIAALGAPLPDPVDDATPLRPRMLYGAHKAMVEQWVATLTRRGALRGISLRLPGIVARPRAASGMKSAFLSEVFHALSDRRRWTSPVSPAATFWLMSNDGVAQNLRHAVESAPPPAEPHAWTLPAVRTSMGELVLEIARQTGADPGLVDYDPDRQLEEGFGRQPTLVTAGARSLGFSSDGALGALVTRALAQLGE